MIKKQDKVIEKLKKTTRQEKIEKFIEFNCQDYWTLPEGCLLENDPFAPLRVLNLVLKEDCALVLSFLLDKAARKAHQMERVIEDIWIRATSNDILGGAFCKVGRHGRILKILQQKGFISVEVRGSPPNRFVKVRWPLIYKRTEEAATRWAKSNYRLVEDWYEHMYLNYWWEWWEWEEDL